jgi:hypothetical protein
VIGGIMPENLRSTILPAPKVVCLVQMSAMMVIIFLLAALIIGLVLATGVVPDNWTHLFANELNKVPMPILLTRIALVMTAVIGALRLQAEILANLIQKACREWPVSRHFSRPTRGVDRGSCFGLGNFGPINRCGVPFKLSNRRHATSAEMHCQWRS